jgi:peptidoglycan/xylan/chitin deacetylase (PgdA/CDA1 family)
MACLKGSFCCLPLSEVARALAEGSPLPEAGVVVTFDDGYVDNLRNALPILERLRVPATLFVATGPVESQRPFWWDEFSALWSEDEQFWPIYQSLRALPEVERADRIERRWAQTGARVVNTGCRPGRPVPYLVSEP